MEAEKYIIGMRGVAVNGKENPSGGKSWTVMNKDTYKIDHELAQAIQYVDEFIAKWKAAYIDKYARRIKRLSLEDRRKEYHSSHTYISTAVVAVINPNNDIILYEASVDITWDEEAYLPVAD